jgi:hypothetical protein
MSIAWVAPAALLGVGLIALPIAIHLLARQHARTFAFPSLRFLRETQLAYFRRRAIQDAVLLLCRIAIVGLAAMALAGPILETSARTASYAGRTSRAVIALDEAGERSASALMTDAFASASFRRSALADALTDAVRWLDLQPRSAREIVIAGTLRRGAVAESDLAIVPQGIGIRFNNVSAPASMDIAWPVLTRRQGSLVRVDRSIHLETDTTRVADSTPVGVASDIVSIVAKDEDAALAQGALAAVLDAGIPWRDFERRVVVVWEGGDASAVTRASQTTTIIRMPVPSPPSSAADAVHRALVDALPRPGELEPVMVTTEQLTSWSRPPQSPSNNAPITDEGDRRWVWAIVLVLLAVEAWLRRRSSSVGLASNNAEARVA